MKLLYVNQQNNKVKLTYNTWMVKSYLDIKPKSLDESASS